MADPGAPVNLIQNSFSAGEIAPSLYGRTDLEKYRQGAAVMRNFFVDVRGGASSRPGTQFIGHPGSAGRVRLIPFIFTHSVGQTYMLVFSHEKLRFIKNPGTPTFPNSSSSAFVQSSGSPYEIATPYIEADLAGLHFVQVRDVMWITRRGHPRRQLKRFADDNWTLTEVATPSTIGSPTIYSIPVTGLPAGSSDPQETRYLYVVSAVDADGVEGLPSAPHISPAGVNIAVTQGTVSVFWTAVAGAAYYKVYKALPTSGNIVPSNAEQVGFAGYSYGTHFTDSNIVPDFVQTPLKPHNPFALSVIEGYTITAPGSGYPVIGTTVSVSDATGSGAVIYPILDTNVAGNTGGIVGLYIANPGSGYTAPTISAAGGGTGFTATLTVGPSGSVEPDVVSLFQQRIVYGSSPLKPSTIFGSRTGALDDFRRANPTVDNDSFEFALTGAVDHINWMESMPGGLLIASHDSIVQLSGGQGSLNNPSAIGPTNAVAVPQTSYGSSHIAPIRIDHEILYVQADGGTVRSLQYNLLANIYNSVDIVSFSTHLFYPQWITSWAYQDSPHKVVWAVRGDGELLSLTYMRSQELVGWAHHLTGGFYEDIAVVPEGIESAIYVSVNRGGIRYIERFAGKVHYQAADAWCLDSALSTETNYQSTTITVAASTGTDVVVTSDAAVFGAGDVGKDIIAIGSRGRIVGFDSTTQVRIDIALPFGTAPIGPNAWRMDPLVGIVTGLDHLDGMEVWALVDGVVQGPFTVVSGEVTLSAAGSSVVVGLRYVCDLQPLYVNIEGELTVQGKRKKVAAASVRVKDSARLQYGTSFSDLREWQSGLSSTDKRLELRSAAALHTGDQRIIVNQEFNTGGWLCVRQAYPLPATVLAIIPEMAQGDTM